MQLWNKYNKEELEKQLREKGHTYVTVSFYTYAKIQNPHTFRNELYALLDSLDVIGRIYVAHEGINAQIAVPNTHFDAFKEALYSIDFLNGIRLNVAVEEEGAEFPFLKLKIKVRDKILADGLNDETFDVTNKGQHLNAEEFNKITSESDFLLVDFRNHYEHEVGHFKDAILPDVDTFRDSLPVIEEEILKGNEDKKVIMYCTGGIRCEKASAWLKYQGFNDVNQLHGGIIDYARQIREQGLPNKFKGRNFVFDERMGERISEDVLGKCDLCGEPCDHYTNCARKACHQLFIQCPACSERLQGCCGPACQELLDQGPSGEATTPTNPHPGKYTKGRLKQENQKI